MRDTPLVIKFGGTSVGGGAQFVRAAKIATEAAQSRPMAVVVSVAEAYRGLALTVRDKLAAARGGTARKFPTIVYA